MTRQKARAPAAESSCRHAWNPKPIMKPVLFFLLSTCAEFAADTLLQRERARFDSEAEAALKPVREAYRIRLQTALDSLIKAGRLEQALDVKKELSSVSESKPSARMILALYGHSGQSWVDVTDRVRTFIEAGSRHLTVGPADLGVAPAPGQSKEFIVVRKLASGKTKIQRWGDREWAKMEDMIRPN